MKLRIAERQANEITVVSLNGHLVMGEESQQLKQLVKKLVDAEKFRIVMNIEGVAFIDSFGVGELVSCLTTMKKSGGWLSLVNPTEFVREVLQVTHLNTVIPIYDTEAEALEHSGQGDNSTEAGANQ